MSLKNKEELLKLSPLTQLGYILKESKKTFTGKPNTPYNNGAYDMITSTLKAIDQIKQLAKTHE